MKSRLRLACQVAVALVALFWLVVPSFALAGSSPQLSSPESRYLAGQVIVRFKPDDDVASIRNTIHAVDMRAEIVKRIAHEPNIALVEFPTSLSVTDMLDLLRAESGVLSAEPNYIVRAGRTTPLAARSTRKGQTPSDAASVPLPSLDVQSGQVETSSLTVREMQAAGIWPAGELNSWGWSYIGAQIIWPEPATGPQVAVLDSGVDYLHPDLAGQILKGHDWINDDLDPMDDYGTGTMLAGVISAKTNNGMGMSGVSNGAVVAIKVLDSQGNGTLFDIIQGLDEAASLSTVKVITLGVGFTMASDALHDTVSTVVNTRGKLLVAAAGDDSDSNPFYPAAYSVDWPGRVLAVAGSGYDDNHQCRSATSNYGDWISLASPGADVYTTTPYDKPFYLNQTEGMSPRYATSSGTSLAAAYVAGSAARTWSLHPAWTNAQVGSQLVSTGQPLDSWIGYDLTGNGDLCWPTALPAHLNEVMVSKAMGREAIDGFTYDAMNALPLTGAKHTAWAGGVAYGYGGKVEGIYSSYWAIINVPRQYTYTLKVNKLGYTAVPQAVESVTNNLSVTCPSCNYWHVGQLSLPPAKANYTFVTEWGREHASGSVKDLDNMLWLPPGNTACIVGNGMLLSSSGCGGNGSLTVFPFARRFRDGSTANVGVEATSIKPPLYPTGDGPYKFYVWSWDPPDGSGLSQEGGGAIVRLWRNGVIMATVNSKIATPAGAYQCIQQGGTNWCPFWYVGDLNRAGVFQAKNRFVDETIDSLPYGPAHSRILQPLEEKAAGEKDR